MISSFTEFEEGTTTFFCKIFFAEQFDALRRNCGCSSQFIESLARCVKWDSSGGRSKVDFLKTKGEWSLSVPSQSRLNQGACRRPLHRQGDLAPRNGRPTSLRTGLLRVHVEGDFPRGECELSNFFEKSLTRSRFCSYLPSSLRYSVSTASVFATLLPAK